MFRPQLMVVFRELPEHDQQPRTKHVGTITNKQKHLQKSGVKCYVYMYLAFSQLKMAKMLLLCCYWSCLSVLKSRIDECSQIFILYLKASVGPVAQSVQRLATGWTVRGSNPGGGEIFRTCPDRPWGPPSLLYNGHRVFPGGRKRPGRDADPSPPSSAEV
jgi:hypothetical protein